MLNEDGGEREIAMHNVILVQIAAEKNLLSSCTMGSSPSLIPSPHSTAIITCSCIRTASDDSCGGGAGNEAIAVFDCIRVFKAPHC